MINKVKVIVTEIFGELFTLSSQKLLDSQIFLFTKYRLKFDLIGFLDDMIVT